MERLYGRWPTAALVHSPAVRATCRRAKEDQRPFFFREVGHAPPAPPSWSASAAAAPSQPDCPGVSRSDHSAGSKESASWRALELRSDWHGRLGVGRRQKEGKETSGRGSQDEPAQDKEELFCSFSLSSTSKFSSLSSTSILISSRCLFSCLSLLCPAPVRPGCLFRLFLSLLSPSSQPPIDRVSPNVVLKLVTRPILFEPAEWSERLTPGQSGWLGAAAVGLIPAFALSLFLQRLNFLLFLQRLFFTISYCWVK